MRAWVSHLFHVHNQCMKLSIGPSTESAGDSVLLDDTPAPTHPHLPAEINKRLAPLINPVTYFLMARRQQPQTKSLWTMDPPKPTRP